MNINSTFEIPLADEETIERIMKKLDTSKATGIDNIPVRLVVVSSTVTKKALTKHDFPNTCHSPGQIFEIESEID